ncbi:MAG: polysaccharide deacetylase family protein [Oscillospiraceae bacterium]
MKRRLLAALAFSLALILTLSACGSGKSSGGGRSDGKGPDPDSVVTPAPATPEPTPKEDPYDAVKNYWSEDQLTQAWGPNQVVEHIFFHPIIAYPEWAFEDGPATQSEKEGLDDWMVTVDEYNKILQSLYDKGYILVAIEDVWSEVTDESGTHMVRNTLMLPEGKKPLIISFDDVNYYKYMLEQGFTSKLVVGDDGQIWAECTDPYTNETFLTQELDATPLLDNFVLEHPDFSLNGAKAVIGLTGYQGILGYRTQTDRDVTDPTELAAFEANRQKEIEAVKPVITRLKETGWTFASHTWAHINLSNKSMERIQDDTQRWLDEVGSLVGPTTVLLYPYGGRPDGDNDVTQTGAQFRYLQEQGFRIFASVGVESYSKVKTDISAVICDRLHPDGTTLRWSRSRYLQFYDAQEIIDLDVRPDLGYKFD